MDTIDDRSRIISEITSDFAYTFRVEPDGNLVLEWITKAFTRVTGFTPEESKARGGWAKLIYPDDIPIALQRRSRLLSGQQDVSEFRIVTKSNELRSLRDHAYPVRDESQGRVVRIHGAAQDITEHKRMGDALLKSEEKYRSLVANVGTGVATTDVEGKFTLVNVALCNMFGYTEEELLGKPFTGFLHPDDLGKILELFKRASQDLTGQSYLEFRGIHKDGHTVFCYSSPTILWQQGKIAGFSAIIQDITERKQGEETLRYQAALLANMKDAFIASDEQYRITAWNAAAEAMYGWSAEEVLGRFGLTITQTEFPGVDKEVMLRAIAETGHWRGEVTQVRRDGSRFSVEISSVVLRDENGRPTGYACVNRDITARKILDATLQRSKAEWENTFDAMSDWVCLINKELRILRTNRAGEEFVKAPIKEMIGQTPCKLLHNSNKPVRGCPMKKMLRTKQRETLEVQSVDGSGWFLITVDPMLDETGKLIGGVHIVSDITRRRQAEFELERSRDQLRALTRYLHSAREEERTFLARELHDELGQALTALKMDLAWFAKKLPKQETALQEKTASMSDLIDDTIQVIRRISTDLRPGMLDDLGLVEALEWQADVFQTRSGITRKLYLPEKVTGLGRDQDTALFRIFQEILTNISRHSNATETRIELKEQPDCLVLTVYDNGRGITENQIHDPRSLGLIGMRERVQAYGGTMNIEGIPGKGTTVMIRVPRATIQVEKEA